MQIGIRRCRFLKGGFFWMIQLAEWCLFVAPSIKYVQMGTPGSTWSLRHRG